MKNNQDFKRLKILYVEDDKAASNILASLLNRYFKEIVVANDGKEGLAKFKEKEFDLIISDINMPNMDGLEMLSEIREFDKDTPIIFTTARNESSSIINAIELDATDYLLKPIAFDKLINKITNVTEKINAKNYKKLLEQYKMVVDEKSIVVKFDFDKKIKYINNEFLNTFGYENNELINQFYDMQLGLYCDDVDYKKMWESLNLDNKTWSGKLRKKTSTGSLVILDVSITIITNILDEIQEYIMVANDITEIDMYNNLLEFKLEEQKNKVLNKAFILNEYKNSLEEFNLFVRLDKSYNIEYINKSFSTILNKSIKKIKGKNFFDIINLDIDFDLDNCFSNSNVCQKLLTINIDSSAFHINFSFSKIYDEMGEFVEFLVIGNDITEVINLHKEIEDTQKDIIFTLGAVGESRSKETANHVKRVSNYSYVLAKLSGMSEEDATLVKMASPMHDLGKIAIPDSILNKEGKLTDTEFEIMKSHTKIGYEILNKSDRKLLKASAIVSYHHHENYDGSGYPQNLKGEEIDIFARIVSIVDVFDALINKRAYKEAWLEEDVINFLKENSSIKFDPNLTKLFLDNFDRFVEINEQYKD